MKSALPRTKFLAIGIAAAITAIPSAFAGPKEIQAIEDRLPANVDIATASEQDLTAAVFAAIDGTKLSPTVIAGEALKGSQDPEFGAFFGAAAFANTTSTRIGDKNKFAAGAAVSASTGKTANATQVPAFASAFFTTNDEAQAVANLAVKSTTAIGAILGGRALEVDEALRLNLANSALVAPKTKKASQQIAQFISAAPAVDDAEATRFAVSVANTNKSFLQKVLVGVTASNPNSASETMRLMLVSSAELQVKKSIPALAKAVGLVADVEQLQLLAARFGAVVTAKQINSTAKALIQAVSGRSLANGSGNDRLVNKGDEIGEIAAYYVAALKNNAATSSKFGVAKSAASFVVSLAKTMFKAAKVKNIKGTQTPTDLQAELVRLPGNFGASFAMTIKALGLPSDVLQAIIDKLALTSTLNSIAGKTLAPALGTAFAAGFGVADPAANTTFENGTLPIDGPTAVSMIDAPETDIRNG